MKNIKSVLVGLVITICISSLSGGFIVSGQEIEELNLEEKIENLEEIGSLEIQDEDIIEIKDEDNIEVSEEVNLDEEVKQETVVKEVLNDEEYFLPSYKIEASKNTLRPNPNDDFSIHLSELDFKLEPGKTAKFIDLEIWTEYYFDSMELQSIELPYITAKDVNGEDLNVDIFFMTLTGGSLWVADPVRISEDNPGHTVYRSEIEAFIEEHKFLPHYADGSWPIKTYMLIQAVPKDLQIPPEETGFDNVHPNEMTFHGDVIYNYKANGKVPYYGSYYDVFTLVADLDVNPGNVQNAIEEDFYLFYETSTLDITADKYTDLNPGDEVELTFTVNNKGKMDNVLTASIDVEGLELIPGSLSPNIDLSDWLVTPEGFELSIADFTDNWIKIAANESISFTQKFKVKDNYSLDTIKIKPALSAATFTKEKEFDEPVLLELAKSEDQESSVVFNYSDVEGNIILDQKVITGIVGDTFEMIIPEIEGYTYKETITMNNTRSAFGVFTEEKQEFNIIYTKVGSDGETEVIEKPNTPEKPSQPNTGIRDSVSMVLSLMLLGSLMLVVLRKRKMN